MIHKLICSLAIICVLGSAGLYLTNIFKLLNMCQDPITGEFVLRVIGIFFIPIGVILGFM